MLAVTNNQGIRFNVRVVLKGEPYGTGYCLTHDKDKPLVEFYDARFGVKGGFDSRGQFISRYYLDTIKGTSEYSKIAGDTEVRGICLQGGIPEWSVTKENVISAIEYAEDLIENKPK